MMKSSITLIAASLLLLPVVSGAAELPIKPGMWETTMTRTNPMTGEPTTETNTRCVKETSFNPSSMMQDAEGCDLVKDELNGNTLTFRMECAMEQGTAATVDGEFTSEGDTGSGTMDMNMNMGEMKMTMNMEWTSKRVGDCSEGEKNGDSSAQQGSSQIRAMCEEEWDTDYRMVKHCIEQQRTAAQNIASLRDNVGEGAEERAIIDRCFQEWLDSQGRPDWRMVEHCSKKQIEAYEELK